MKYLVWTLGPEPEDRTLVGSIDTNEPITVTYSPTWAGSKFLTPIKFHNQELYPENGKYYIAALHAAFESSSRILVVEDNEEA